MLANTHKHHSAATRCSERRSIQPSNTTALAMGAVPIPSLEQLRREEAP